MSDNSAFGIILTEDDIATKHIDSTYKDSYIPY